MVGGVACTFGLGISYHNFGGLVDFPLPENITIHHPVVVYTRGGVWVAEDPMTKLEGTADSPGGATHNLHTRLQVLARTSYEKRQAEWEAPAVPEKKGGKGGK